MVTKKIISTDGSTSMSFLPERGGVANSLIMPTQQGPREMLYLHDFFEKEWNDLPGGWPFLFPVCARLARDGQAGVYLYEGKQYRLNIHGFSWMLPWDVIAEEKSSITLRLCADQNTKEIYPFDFELVLKYRVDRALLTCEMTCINHGDKAMPYYAGFHPYFLTPAFGAGKEKVMLDYEPIRRFIYNEKLTDIIGDQPLFTLPTSILDPNIQEQLTLVGHNKVVKLHYPEGMTVCIEAVGVEDYDAFSYVQLYTRREKPFFCAEHWMSFPNAMNTVQGVRWLQSGESERGIMRVTCCGFSETD